MRGSLALEEAMQHPQVTSHLLSLCPKGWHAHALAVSDVGATPADGH